MRGKERHWILVVGFYKIYRVEVTVRNLWFSESVEEKEATTDLLKNMGIIYLSYDLLFHLKKGAVGTCLSF
jgi:hypothetical protein